MSGLFFYLYVIAVKLLLGGVCIYLAGLFFKPERYLPDGIKTIND